MKINTAQQSSSPSLTPHSHHRIQRNDVARWRTTCYRLGLSTQNRNLLSQATGRRAKIGAFVFRILSATFVLWLCFRGTAIADVLYTLEESLPLPWYAVAHANAINDSGQGPVRFAQSAYLPWLGECHPLGWTAKGAAQNDINNSGQIVGVRWSASSLPSHPPIRASL